MGAVIILVIGGLLSAVLIVPRQREMRRHGALVASLHVGDPVMTGSGIYGTITELTDDLVGLEVAPGTTIRVARRAIAAKVDEPATVVDITDDGGADQTPAAAPDQLDPVDHDADGLQA